jgi:hypothetical protein
MILMNAAMLATIQQLAAADLFTFVTGDIIHALSGLGVFRDDVRESLLSATSCVAYAVPEGSWLVEGGVTSCNDSLRIVVIVQDDMLIVSVGRA